MHLESNSSSIAVQQNPSKCCFFSKHIGYVSSLQYQKLQPIKFFTVFIGTLKLKITLVETFQLRENRCTGRGMCHLYWLRQKVFCHSWIQIRCIHTNVETFALMIGQALGGEVEKI